MRALHCDRPDLQRLRSPSSGWPWPTHMRSVVQGYSPSGVFRGNIDLSGITDNGTAISEVGPVRSHSQLKFQVVSPLNAACNHKGARSAASHLCDLARPSASIIILCEALLMRPWNV